MADADQEIWWIKVDMTDVRSSVAWTIAETVATLLASISMLLIVARIIGPQSFGIASIVFFIGSLSESFISLTFTEPLIQKRNLSQKFINTAFSIMLISSIIIYIFLIAISPLIGLAYGEPILVQLIAAQGLTCLFLGVRGVPEAILARSMKFRALALRGIAAKTIGALTAIVLALAGAGAWSVILGNVMYSVTAAALVWIMRTQSVRLAFDRNDAVALLRFGRFSFADALLTTASARIYGLLVAYFYDVRTFGEISVAFRFNDTIVSLLGQTVTRIALPVMSNVSNDYRLLFLNWLAGTRIVMLVTIPAMFGVAAVGPDLIETTLGALWKGAAPALAAISIYSAFNLSAVLVGPALKASGQPSKLIKIHFYSISFLLTATIASSLWGIYVTLIVYSMLGFVYWITSMYTLHSALNINPIQKQGIPSLLIWVASLVMALSIIYERLLLESMLPAYRLLLLIFTGVVIYSFLILLVNRKIITDLFRQKTSES